MKKGIIPKDTRYVPLTQQKWCCVPTCIQMVMLRYNIPLIPAEVIGDAMGLLVPKRDLKYFWDGKTGPKPKAGYGTQLNEQVQANKLFEKLGIPLRMKWYLIDEFPDLSAFRHFLENIHNKDILICFDWGTLKNSNYHFGHVCVLDKIYLDKGEVRFIDPDFDSPKWQTVKIAKLYKAMQHHGKENSAGFWELHTAG